MSLIKVFSLVIKLMIIDFILQHYINSKKNCNMSLVYMCKEYISLDISLLLIIYLLMGLLVCGCVITVI